MASKYLSINLIKSKQDNLFDKTIGWVLTIGRLIVIVTEIVALSAFLYRFSLDRRIIDLHDQIKHKQTIVAYSKNNEERFRDLQDRLALASNLSSQGTKIATILPDIVNLTPSGVKFRSFSVQADRITINGNSRSPQTIDAFVNSLKSYSHIKSVSLDSIETKSSNNITISITALLK